MTHTQHCTLHVALPPLRAATLSPQGLLDVINADDNAPLKVLRLRIKDETGGQAQGANVLQPLDGDDPGMKPVGDDTQVSRAQPQSKLWLL